MKDIKAYYRTAIKVADTMLKDPKNSVNEVLKTQLGYKSGIKGFFSDPWNWLFFAHPLTLGRRWNRSAMRTRHSARTFRKPLTSSKKHFDVLRKVRKRNN